MELNKTIQYLKMEVETMKETQRKTTLEIKTVGKKSGTIDVSISNRKEEMEERISGTEHSIENMGTTIKENAKCKKILTQNIQEIQDTMRKPKGRKWTSVCSLSNQLLQDNKECGCLNRRPPVRSGCGGSPKGARDCS